MNYDPNSFPADDIKENNQPETELATTEQLEEFNDRIRELISGAKFPWRHEDSVGVRFYNRYGLSTVIGIARGVILFSPDAVDLHIRRVIKEADESGHSLEKYEDFAYSPSSGTTLYEERVAGFINGQRLRSEDEQKGIPLLAENLDEALILALDYDALDTAEGPLADHLRDLRSRREATAEDRILTKGRMEVALEELRSLTLDDEEIPESVISKMVPGLFTDMLLDELTGDENETA